MDDYPIHNVLLFAISFPTFFPMGHPPTSWRAGAVPQRRLRVELCRANSAASIATTCPSLTSISRGTAAPWSEVNGKGIGSRVMILWWLDID